MDVGLGPGPGFEMKPVHNSESRLPCKLQPTYVLVYMSNTLLTVMDQPK